MKIDIKMYEYKQKIDEIEKAGKQLFHPFSRYFKYIEEYEKAKILLETENDKGQALVKQIHNNIREILISIQLSFELKIIVGWVEHRRQRRLKAGQ